jgi:hypothetical protein
MLQSAMKWMYATSNHHNISVLTVGEHHNLLHTGKKAVETLSSLSGVYGDESMNDISETLQLHN